jgi:hypothetical protein
MGTGGSKSAGGVSSNGGAVASGGSQSDAQVIPMICTMGGGECPAGWQCACRGNNNPSLPPGCSCAKECQSAADCQAPDSLCGCSANGPAQGLCVSNCFCVCG